MPIIIGEVSRSRELCQLLLVRYPAPPGLFALVLAFCSDATASCFLFDVNRPCSCALASKQKMLFRSFFGQSHRSHRNHGRNIIAARNAGGKSTQGARETRTREPRHSPSEGSADTALIWDGNGRLPSTHCLGFLGFVVYVTTTTRRVLLGTASGGQFACAGP